jgi:hypothetical protein
MLSPVATVVEDLVRSPPEGMLACVVKAGEAILVRDLCECMRCVLPSDLSTRVDRFVRCRCRWMLRSVRSASRRMPRAAVLLSSCVFGLGVGVFNVFFCFFLYQ